MKRQIQMALLVLILLSVAVTMTACGKRKESEIRLYYRQANITYEENGLIGSQPVLELDQSVIPDVLAQIYFETKPDQLLDDTFPESTQLVATRMEHGVLYLTLSDHFAVLQGIDLSLALTCITMTFSQLPEVEFVEVALEHGLLQGKDSIRISTEDIMLIDDGQTMQNMVLNLYQIDDQKQYLIPVPFWIEAGTIEEQARQVMEQLRIGIGEAQSSGILPENTEILNLNVEHGLCIVDFSEEFYDNRPENASEERLMIFAIINTLTEFQEIQKVQFRIEGTLCTEYGEMDLSGNFGRDTSLIGPT